MTEAPKTETMPDENSRPLTPLEIFFVKLGGITTAAIVFLVCSTLFLQSLIESKIDEMSFLKGGHVFWENLEKKMDAFANGDDIATNAQLGTEGFAALIKSLQAETSDLQRELGLFL